MPIPSGTYAITGPILDISGGLLTPTAALAAAGVVTVRGGKVRRVNSAGDGWEEVPGHVIAATEPAARFEGLLWYDTATKVLKHYNGSAFAPVSSVTSSGDVADLSITTAKLAANAVTTEKIETNAVTKNKIQSDAVGEHELSISSVTQDKLRDDAVTQRKIADNAVGSGELRDDAVDTDAIVDDAVTSDKLASNSVTNDAIADDAVAQDQLATNSVTTDAIADDSATPAKLDADDANKQDLFLTRLNALRRDLNNIATLSASGQRAALSGLGAILEGGRPAPSANYAGRVWIDGTNDQAHICRNDPEYTTAVQGGFYGATIPSTVQVGEYVEDLTAPIIANEWAYTFGDNHFWVGTPGTGLSFYFGQTDEHTVLGQLATSGNVGEWLGQSDWDGTAQTRLPTDALPTLRDYFFWNNRTRSIRQFNRANYQPAGSPIDHWKWFPVSTIAANISIFDGRDGNLPSLPSDGSKNSWIGVANDGLWFVEKRTEFTAAGSVASWADWTHSSSSPTRVYKGAFNGDTPESVSGATLGDFYYNHRDRTWRSYQVVDFISIPGGIWGEMHSTDSGWPPSFIGDFDNQADAIASAHLHDIQAGASFTAYTGTKVQQASTYVVPQGANYSVHWRFLPVNHLSSGDVSASDDYVATLAFSVATGGVVSLIAGMHGGGNVTATGANLLASLVGPTFTGAAKAVTAAVGTDTTQIATTAFVAAEIVDLAAAPLDSPVFTGTPTSPTPLATGGELEIATKKYVDDNAGGALADDAVTTAKIKDLNVTTAKLAANSVTKIKMADNAVSTAEIEDDSVSADKIKNGAVTRFKIADDSVHPDKLLAVTADQKTAIRTRIAAAGLANPVFTGVPQAPHPMANGLVSQVATVRYVNEQATAGAGLGDPTTILVRPTAATQQGAVAGVGATEVTLTEVLVKGRLLEFIVTDTSTDGHIESIGYLMSDAILALTAIASAGTPHAGGSDEDSIAIKLHQPGNVGYSHTSLRIWRSGDSSGMKIWAHSGRDASIRLSIKAYDLTGGGSGGATGAGGGTSGSSTTVNTRRLQLILHQWGATKPADPTQVWGATGWSGVIDGNAASSWVEDEPTVVPAGTHWIALANAYSGDAGTTWVQYAWSVFSVGAGYLAEQYSEDASSWHTTRTDYDFWMRLRRPDGTWTGSIALRAVPWQPILDWADVYRPNYDANATVSWKFGINLVDLLTYNDLVLDARFFYYINGPPDEFSSVARAIIPFGPVNKDGALGTYTPSTQLRWQTLPQDFVLTDWTSTVPARVARRLGVFRAVLDRDNGLSVVLGESARSTPDDIAYQRATICFGLQTSSTGAYNSTINAVAIHVPVGTQAYSRTQIRIMGR